MLRQIMPADGEIKLLNRFQYRALKPTWPVAFSLLFLSLAFLIPDQGRAIIKYTINRAGFDIDTVILIGVFVGHGIVMMYTAFMLSAVTRRSQMDAQTDYFATAKRDPIDPSISLRLRYAYWCGVFLPLLFMLMGFWFQYGLYDFRFWTIVAAGIGFGFLCYFIARECHEGVARRRAVFNQLRTKPGWKQKLQYTGFSFLHFCFAPEHRTAQSAIVGLMFSLIILTVGASYFEWAQYPGGAWMFFACFIFLHLVFRYFKDRIVRLHQGHTARYIIIDPLAELIFRCARVVGIILIPLVFWFPPIVAFLGPLGVGLFGTLWATLFFSGLVESSARHARAYHGNIPPDTSKRSWMHRLWDEFQSMRRAYSLKSWFFLLLIGLLFIELLVSSLEVLVFEPRFTADMLIFLLLFGVFVLRKRIWSNRLEFRAAVNQLPSASVLAPILLLGLGEAHHIHRLAVTESDTEFQAHDIDAHAAQWLAARKSAASAEYLPIPAIIVLAEGGGIRAGAHAGYYLSRLDSALLEHCQNATLPDRLCRQNANTRLLDHVYSINGVSGGAVGSAVYLGAVKEELTNNLTAGQRHHIIDETLKSDFLSPLFAGLFGSDVLTTILPAQISDRVVGLFDRTDTDAVGEAYERGIYDRADFFENRLAIVFDRALNGPYPPEAMAGPKSDIAAKTTCRATESRRGRRTMDQTLESVSSCAVRGSINRGESIGGHQDPGPMVFFSTFYETGGYQMATSNVDVFAGQSGGVAASCGSVPIVQQMIDRVEPEAGQTAGACPKRSQTLPISTAAHLSARFPVSNPTGVIETRYENGRWKRHYFVDGGYMDNSGALTAIQSVEALRRQARDAEVQVNVIVLHLYALTIPSQDADQNPRGQRATKQNEFASIPSAVLKARGAASRAPIRLLCNSLLDFSDGKLGPEACDEIFDRRIVTRDEAPLFSTETYEALKEGNAPRCPVDPSRNKAIVLNIADKHGDDRADLETSEGDVQPTSDLDTSANEAADKKERNPIGAAAWIPVPLEVAGSDRQTNAITALLGWSLLEETTIDMNAVMEGTAAITLGEIVGLVSDPDDNAPGESRDGRTVCERE
ncbi:MAG: hypothetical protein AAFN91_00370 [Pseudomonadota bacterium]